MQLVGELTYKFCLTRYTDLPERDKYMLHRIIEVFNDITDAYDSYQFYRFFQTVQNFFVVDLSNFYLDIARDRLYISSLGSFRRRSCQTVLAITIENLAKAIAPVLSHMAEDIWQALPYETGCPSVFQAGWLTIDEQWQKPDMVDQWENIRNLRDEVNKVMEEARQNKAIGSSIDAKVLLNLGDTDLKVKLADYKQVLSILNLP